MKFYIERNYTYSPFIFISLHYFDYFNLIKKKKQKSKILRKIIEKLNFIVVLFYLFVYLSQLSAVHVPYCLFNPSLSFHFLPCTPLPPHTLATFP